MQPLYLLVLAFGVALAVAVPVLGFGRKGEKKYSKYVSPKQTLDKKFVQGKWFEIENAVKLAGPSNFKSAIMEADKLVDYVLKCQGLYGETMGERLKSAKGKFSNYSDYDNLWFAHKVRNNIAHEASHDLNSAEAKRAIEYYRQALRILGAL